jgi:membrane protease YdiL (CAAX protease family)
MRRTNDWLWALAFAAAAVGFALTAHRDAWAPWRWAFLAAAGIAICGGWILLDDPLGTIFGRVRAGRLAWWMALAGILAVLAAIVYRWALGEKWFPSSLHWFVWGAVGIGAAEEVLWRGWIQGTLAKVSGPYVAVFAAAGAHAAYKTALFAFPPDGMARQSCGALMVMAGMTLGFGAVLGAIRVRQGTIAAPVAFHVLFDLLVYGDGATAPWWVWQ